MAQDRDFFFNINLLYPLEDAAQAQTLGLGQQVKALHWWEGLASLRGLLSSDCHHRPRRCQPPWMSNMEVMAALTRGLGPVPGAPDKTR